MHRLRTLAKLRMLPAIYGEDIKQAVKQRYSGDVTILPSLGGASALLRMVQNPDREMMQSYIANGELIDAFVLLRAIFLSNFAPNHKGPCDLHAISMRSRQPCIHPCCDLSMPCACPCCAQPHKSSVDANCTDQ